MSINEVVVISLDLEGEYAVFILLRSWFISCMLEEGDITPENAILTFIRWPVFPKKADVGARNNL